MAFLPVRHMKLTTVKLLNKRFVSEVDISSISLRIHNRIREDRGRGSLALLARHPKFQSTVVNDDPLNQYIGGKNNSTICPIIRTQYNPQKSYDQTKQISNEKKKLHNSKGSETSPPQ